MRVPVLPSGMVRTSLRLPRPTRARKAAGPRKYAERKPPPPPTSTPNGLASLVYRLPRDMLDAVRELAEDTRVRQSDYFREALADMLRKHGAL